jgi:hypothetical protein
MHKVVTLTVTFHALTRQFQTRASKITSRITVTYQKLERVKGKVADPRGFEPRIVGFLLRRLEVQRLILTRPRIHEPS